MHLQERKEGKGKAENCTVLTNQLNNIKCLEKESYGRNSDLPKISHQNKQTKAKTTTHKEESETKSSVIHPLKNAAVSSVFAQ